MMGEPDALETSDPLRVWQAIPSGTQRLVLDCLRMEADKQMNVLPFREAADALEALMSGTSWS